MKTEDWNLLKRDLCARLPYGVIIQVPELFYATIDVKLDAIFEVDDDFRFTKSFGYLIENVKPYLRPMSSMTDEERKEFTKLFCKWHDDELFDYIEEGAEFSIWKHKGISPVVFDWLNKKMFDYRGLIEKGLALEAPENMYNIK